MRFPRAFNVTGSRVITRLWLVDGDDEFVFQDNAVTNYDVVWTKLTVPSPAVRAVATDRTGADGSIDRTQFHGSRSVSLDVSLFDAPAEKVDRLNTFMLPRKRPYLYIRDTDWWGDRRLRLRADQWSNVIDTWGSWRRDVQLQWVAPDGVYEAADSVGFTVNAAADASPGRTYALTPPREYPPGSYRGRVDITNPGNTYSNFVARLYGPCVGPRLTNDATGDVIQFTSSLIIPAGEYVEVDTLNRTAFYMSDPSLTRLSMIDFQFTTWWRLLPGVNQVRYNPVSGVDVGCAALVDYRPSWV